MSSMPELSHVAGKSESSKSSMKERDSSSGPWVTGMLSGGNRGFDESALAQCKSVLRSSYD